MQVLMQIAFCLLILDILNGCFSSSLIVVNSTSGLETLLCGRNVTSFTGDTVIILDPTVHHTIQYKGFCMVGSAMDGEASITITSRSDHQYALVNCNHKMSTFGTAGFFFWNMHNISIIRLVFSNCGAPLQTLPIKAIVRINSSQLHFAQSHGAVLLINGVSTSLVQVNITKYFGFAVIGRNIPLGNIHIANISQNAIDPHPTGSGIILLYQPDEKFSYNAAYLDLKFKVTISQSVFENNHEWNQGAQCPLAKYKYMTSNFYTALTNGPALTVVYSQSTTSHIINASTVISNCTFMNNSGHPIGSVLMMNFNSLPSSEFIVDNNCTFIGVQTNNRQDCGGSLLYMYIQDFQSFHHGVPASNIIFPITVSETLFSTVNNYLQNSAITVFFKNIHFPLLLKFRAIIFIQKNLGVIAVVNNMIADPEISTQRTVQIVLEDVKAFRHDILHYDQKSYSETGSFQFYNIQKVIIKGSSQDPSVFVRLLGPIIKATNTDVVLQGKIYFMTSQAINGAAININNGFLFLKSGLVAYFADLRASKKGGAIYISSTTGFTFWDVRRCSMQISRNVSAVFKENYVIEAGNSVFITNMHNCYMEGNTWINESTLVYKNALKFGTNLSPRQNISTTPKNISVCKPLNSDKEYYPGEDITFGIRTTALNNQSVFSQVSIVLVYSKGNYGVGNNVFWKISAKDQQKIIQENINKTCTNVSIKFLGSISKKKYNFAKSKKSIMVIIEGNIMAHIPIKLNKICPLGFQHYLTSLSCDCSEFFLQIAKVTKYGSFSPVCNITTRTLPFLSPVAWIGIKNMTLAMSLHCNTDHCNTIPKTYNFKVEKGAVFLTDHTITFNICQGSRKGILCSECPEGESAVFGSTDCVRCSNWWILTLVLYIIAGPLLVYLLLSLNLTLAKGTLNGIITFAHLSNGGLLYSLRQHEIHPNQHKYEKIFAKICHVFISLLNLNIGFPLCFYDGMNELWKSGFSLLFPLYLLVIAIFLIVASHYSSLLSNRISDSSVQVLVTIIHLSFSRLLLALTDVLTGTHIYVESITNVHKVWLNDGTLVFGSGPHLILTLLTMAIVGLSIVPYAVVLTAGVFLMKQRCIRKYLRPYYEAIHGPYKNNKEYWFVLRNLLVIFVITLFVIMGESNQLANSAINTPILLIFIVAQTYAMPYKNKALNILDTVILLDYNVIIATTWYFYYTNEVWKSKVIIIAMVMLLFVIFIGIVVYHILSTIRHRCRLLRNYDFNGKLFCLKKKEISDPAPPPEDDELLP